MTRTIKPSTRGLTVLILGATGTFGRRIAELLVADRRFSVICTSRRLDRARHLAAEIGATSGVAMSRPDVPEAGAEQFRQLGADVVIDASGPFQAYGGSTSRYTTAIAALQAGCCYLDLADDPGFVGCIDTLDAEARAANVYVLSGASSFPVLVEAAVRQMAPAFARIDDVEAGIAPSPRARVGRNVLRAILSYAGHPTSVLTDGRIRNEATLVSTRRKVIAPHGVTPLPETTFSLFAVPDLVTLPRTGLVTGSVWAGAGPRPAVLHWCLRMLARTVDASWIASLEPLSPLVDMACGITCKFGRDRGGMYVTASGPGHDGHRTTMSFDLIAEGPDGPMIPAMAAVAILRRHADGHRPDAGARPAGGAINMSDYDTLFAGRRIVYGFRELAKHEVAFVYDGHCVLCSRFARHVVSRDPTGRIRLIPSQS